MKVSVVIPAINEARDIAEAVQSAWGAGAEQVIVADGGSQDRTREVASSAGCEVVDSPPGRGIQQNAGARRARGDVLLFLHADNRLGVETVRQVEAALDDSRFVGGYFRQRIRAAGVLFRCLERGNAVRAHWLRLPYGDQGLFVRRQAFQRMGGFPEIPLMEDVVFGRRLRSVGKLALLPGPLHVDARRWRRHGIVRQTFRNWCLLTLFKLGVSPTRLARRYRRHDQ